MVGAEGYFARNMYIWKENTALMNTIKQVCWEYRKCIRHEKKEQDSGEG